MIIPGLGRPGLNGQKARARSGLASLSEPLAHVALLVVKQEYVRAAFDCLGGRRTNKPCGTLSNHSPEAFGEPSLLKGFNPKA
jgi:hypothetical protein